jgi:hypothetical protein
MYARLRSVISWRVLRLVVGLCVSAWIPTSLATADDLVHVEEDWELVIGEPDSNSAGPQVACTMSPYGDIDNTYFTFEMNHQSVPYWQPGGLTLHQWSGEWLIQSMNRQDRSVMQSQDETVIWTQVLDVDDGRLTFQIKNGVSSTWGTFGMSGYLRLQTWWGPDHLNNYTPDVSVARSGVAFAGNRVKSLKILRVRGRLESGTTATDDTVRVVHQLATP